MAETTTAWPPLPPVELDVAALTAPGNRRRDQQFRNSIDRLRQTMPGVATKIENFSWIVDGISAFELWAANGLPNLAAAGYVEKLVDLPWVVEGRIHPALESLSSLEEHYPEFLGSVMVHPNISDGITEQEAKTIAPLYMMMSNPDLQDTLLDPEQVSLEERVIELPLSGEIELTIIRTRPGTELTMDLLEHVVRNIEEFMGIPFPRQQLIFFFEDDPNLGGAQWFESHVSILPDEHDLSEEHLLDVLTHEGSHYFWNVRTHWIREGAATFIESIPKDDPHGTLDIAPCALYRTIAEIDDRGDDPSIPRICYYALGERLFHDLYRNMDETTFRLAFRRLYLHTAFNDSYHEPKSATPVISHVREAFKAYVSEESAAALERVISRWYDGSELYDLSGIDDSSVEVELPAIAGRIEQAYLSHSKGGAPVPTVAEEADRNTDLYLNLDYSYEPSAGLEFLPIEIAVSFEDGFEFDRRRTKLPLPVYSTQRTHGIWIPRGEALGRYWVQAYWEGQKIAEVTYESVRVVDRRSIRGVVTAPEGRLPGTVALSTYQGEERFSVETGPSGVFNLDVPSGSFALELSILVGSVQHFVGWYDGSGGVTTDSNQAFEIIVDGASVNGIAIKIPAISDASIRGLISGPDGRPQTDTELSVRGADQEFTSLIERDGAFNVPLPPGAYTLEVTARVGSQWRKVGWYDGKGGVTTVRSQAYEVGVYGADVEGIEIMLPAVEHRISGVFTGPDGLPPLSPVALNVRTGDVPVWVKSGSDGSFKELLSSESYTLEVLLAKARADGGRRYYFVGWYDGKGGITTEPDQAFKLILEDADVEGIEIMLPADTDSLFCSKDSHRSTVTGRCPWD